MGDQMLAGLPSLYIPNRCSHNNVTHYNKSPFFIYSADCGEGGGRTKGCGKRKGHTPMDNDDGMVEEVVLDPGEGEGTRA